MRFRALLGVNLLAVSLASGAGFESAMPVWPAGLNAEMNVFAGFRAVVTPPAGERVRVKVAASSLYRLTVNGKFRGHGPARGPHGYYRVDEWDISDWLRLGDNVVAFEVAGYNVNSYYLLDQPAFLQAEIVTRAGVLAATGQSGFAATVLAERVRKVQRYSFQRTFSEVYRLSDGWDRWKRDPAAPFKEVRCDTAPAKKLLSRRVPYPAFAPRQPEARAASGKIEWVDEIGKVWKDRALTQIGPLFKGFPERDLEVVPSIELQHYRNASSVAGAPEFSWNGTFQLAANAYQILDFGTNLTGFPGATVTCKKPATLYLLFDEILSGGDVDFKRLGCVNALRYDLSPGTYRLESFEPYTLRYLKLMVTKGECGITRPTLREYANPNVAGAQFAASDERLNRIFAAGRETFRQNAVDLFMDCPSRERAGWLADSFFTARVAADLSGDTAVEHAFIENYRLPKRFAHLPEGMLPMCYPADHYNGNFIPNWALWFVLQLEEYEARSGDREMVRALRPRIGRMFEYFRRFENEDGLLEKLEKWVFVEWSAANRFVQDVNYPSNMLYAGALDAAARMYNVPAWREKAGRIRDVVRKQSFDGRFFVDNAVRKDGRLEVTSNRTEVCQYFAFYFDVATPESHPKLWRVLAEEFGPDRVKQGRYSEIYPANMFIGNVMRLELLSRFGRSRQVVEESMGYLLYMAERTGTLWENVDPSASLDHGFASHAVHVLYRDVLGLYNVDRVKRRVTVRFSESPLAWCEGRMPVAGGFVSLRWRKDSDAIRYQLDVPAGYQVEVSNTTGKRLLAGR